jgi:LEA14-like dessication related protein
MNKILTLCLTVVTLFGCGVNKQAQQIAALEKCTYKLISAENITIGGTSINNIANMENLNLASLPGLALGLLRQDVPLKARLNLEIKNPSSSQAAINEFEYKVLINNQELATGFVNQLVDVQPGGTTMVPVDLNLNAYKFISNKKVMQEVVEFLQAGSGTEERKGLVTLKIKPSIKVGNTLVKYPGFISMDKEISSKILL